ncbi:MAG TPA: hypothetical protein VIS03_19420 [Kiloniellaceae bacterium]
MAGAAPQPKNRQSNSHIVALLSLKILLLAFFILLNALATFQEERSSAVVDSVRDAFQGLLPVGRRGAADPGGVGLFDGGEDIVDNLMRLFGNDLPLVELPASSGARVLQIDVPVTDLFDAEGSAVSPEGAETLSLVAGVLADPRFADQQARVDVLYGLSGAASGLADNRGALLRAAALVRVLESQSVAPARLSAGLLPSFPGKVRLHFTVAVAPAPGGENQP